MHDRTRARVLVALAVVGVALTGLVVWITTPASTAAGTDLDAAAVAALGTVVAA